MVKLKASSLIEVIVALLLLSIISTVTIVIYLNISKSVNSNAGFIYQNQLRATWTKIDSCLTVECLDSLEIVINKNNKPDILSFKVNGYEKSDLIYEASLSLQDTSQNINITEKKLYYFFQ